MHTMHLILATLMATPAPVEATPAPVEATPAPVEATPAPCRRADFKVFEDFVDCRVRQSSTNPVSEKVYTPSPRIRERDAWPDYKARERQERQEEQRRMLAEAERNQNIGLIVGSVGLLSTGTGALIFVQAPNAVNSSSVTQCTITFDCDAVCIARKLQ